jgi:hypothetical protein
MLVAIGGQCRNVGKTSLICSIIRETMDAGWIAVKISRHRHGATIEGARLDEELGRATENDTGRFLRAGARRAFWLRAPGEDMGPAGEHLRQLMKLGPCIVESNSVLGAVKPDLYFLVMNPALPDVKESAVRYGALADAIVSQSSLARAMREGQRVLLMTEDYRSAEAVAMVGNSISTRRNPLF